MEPLNLSEYPFSHRLVHSQHITQLKLQCSSNMPPRFIPSIASQSLGKPGLHDLKTKLSLASEHGFRAVELFMADLEAVASKLSLCYPAEKPGYSFSGSTGAQERLVAAATYVRELCNRFGLQVLCLQPFMNYGGILDANEQSKRLAELQFWFLLAKTLRTDLIQVPSSFLPQNQVSNDLDRIATDMRQIADLGLSQKPPIRFCYEALCWGTQVDKWEQAYTVVEKVQRPNFGTCLDTFNICGRVFADPTAPNGCTDNAEEMIRKTINRLKGIDLKKIFYVEACDGERLEAPLDEKHFFHVDGQPARMSWSRNARLFPCEEKGYLPVLPVLHAIIALGYKGHISFEVFNRSLNETGKNVPVEHAGRAQSSWNKLSEIMGWGQKLGEKADLEESICHLARASI
jgi:4-hydroxyphenylpyruvate dioxygenase